MALSSAFQLALDDCESQGASVLSGLHIWVITVL